jgi:hypothetical protein
MLRTLPLEKGGTPGTAEPGVLFVFLLFPSEAVPTTGTMLDRTSSQGTRSDAALFLEPRPYLSRMVKNGISRTTADYATDVLREHASGRQSLCLKVLSQPWRAKRQQWSGDQQRPISARPKTRAQTAFASAQPIVS